jgi:DNA polymerase-1
MLTLEQVSKLEGTVVLDVETTGLHWWEDSIIGMGFFHPESGESGYFPTCVYEEEPYGAVRTKKTRIWTGDYYIASDTGRRRKVYEERVEIQQSTRPVAVPVPELVEVVRKCAQALGENPRVTILGHNLKFDAHFLGLNLWRCKAAIADTTIMVHLWDSRLRKSLADCEKHFLGTASKRSLVEEAKFTSKYKLPKYWMPDMVDLYCRNDCIVTGQLAEVLMPLLEEMELVPLYNLQMRFLRLLWNMENVGMLVDIPQCQRSLEAFSASLAEMEKRLAEETGSEFNWRSNPQLSAALYEGMGVERPVNPFADEDGVDRTKFAHRGRYNQHATSSFLLMEKAQHPLGWLIMDLREADKLRKTTSSYIELADRNSVIHASFKPAGTRTGRLSCGEPNLQNIASDHRVRETQSVYSGGGIRSEQYNLRRNFIARPGHKFVSLDHKQQEMRMFGILAEDDKMMEILASGMDVHLGVALMVWGDCGEERNALHREWSKTIGFGLIYGMTTGSLQFRLNKTAEEALALAEEYWGTFPRIQPFLRETIEEMHQYGYVRYWSGRIWREEEPDDFYKAANAQVQGGSADLMSLVCVRMQRVLDAQDWGNVVSIVHDELVLELKEECMAEAIPVLARIMWAEDIFNLPFFCDLKTGPSYGELEKGTLDRDTIREIDWKSYLKGK